MATKAVPLALVADPVRYRLLARLERGGPATIDELSADAGVHVNTVRAHVAPLERAGVLVREHVQTGSRGRPPLRYALAAGWRLEPADLGGLAEVLAATVAALDPDDGELQAIGRDWGRWLAGRPGAQDLDALVGPAMASLGFDARRDGDAIELRACPCPAVLPDRPALLCRLAAAIVDGMASATRERHGVAAGEHDPVARRCVLRLGPRRAS